MEEQEQHHVAVAIQRVYRHRENLVRVNQGYTGGGSGEKEAVDLAIRCALTRMLTGEAVTPPAGTDASLRYIRDRVNVPRDMPVHSAKLFRQSLEDTAAMVGGGHANPIPIKHRKDQSPLEFLTTACDHDKHAAAAF